MPRRRSRRRRRINRGRSLHDDRHEPQRRRPLAMKFVMLGVACSRFLVLVLALLCELIQFTTALPQLGDIAIDPGNLLSQIEVRSATHAVAHDNIREST